MTISVRENYTYFAPKMRKRMINTVQDGTMLSSDINSKFWLFFYPQDPNYNTNTPQTGEKTEFIIAMPGLKPLLVVNKV
jgi:hypothetical protein